MDNIIIYTPVYAKNINNISNDNLDQEEINPFINKDIKNINDVIINKKNISENRKNKNNHKSDFNRHGNELHLSHKTIKYNGPKKKNSQTNTVFYENKNQYKNKTKLNYHQKKQNQNQLNIIRFIEPNENHIRKEEENGDEMKIKSETINNNIIIPVIKIKSEKRKPNISLNIKNIQNYLDDKDKPNLDDDKNITVINRINEVSNNYTINKDQNNNDANQLNSKKNSNDFININSINYKIKKSSKKINTNYQNNQGSPQELVLSKNIPMIQNPKNTNTGNILNVPQITIIRTNSFKYKNILSNPDITAQSQKNNEQKVNIQRNNSLNSIQKIDDLFINLSSKKTINYNHSYSPRILRRRTSLLWKKAKIFQKMLIGLKNPPVTKIDDNLIFSNHLTSTLLDKSNEEKIKSASNKKKDNTITYKQFIKKNEIEKDFVRISLREKAYKLIMEGVNKKNKNLVDEMEKIFLQNPERNFLPDDKNIFNQKLGNGKTLLYVACQEGCTDLVQFFLNNQLNPNIPVKYFGLEDTCLSVASRWGFYEIVKLLLECKRLDPENITDVYYSNISNSNIKNLLKKNLPKNLKKKQKL